MRRTPLELQHTAHAVGLGRRERGQIIVLFSLFFVVLLLLAGSAYDYGSLVLDDTNLQNAADAASLAGADSLSQNILLPPATEQAVTVATTTAYLALDGVATATPGTTVSISFPTPTPAAGATPSPVDQTVTVDVRRNHPTVFWRLAGIFNVAMHSVASAQAAHTMADVMLSLDMTGSMEITGSLQAAQAAAAAFINEMNPSATDPTGPRIGIARYAGIICTYTANDTYSLPCRDDKTLLSGLTNNKALLLEVASGSGGVACPPGVSPYGCPLAHVPQVAPGAGAFCRQASTMCPSGTSSPYYSGTKEPNSISVLGTGATYVWATANGGRNNVPVGTGNARKVLIIMTDGIDEPWPDPGCGSTACWGPPFLPQNVQAYDPAWQASATLLKRGPDGIAGTADDVEIYTVGFFCTPYSTGLPPGNFCASALADTSAPHPCPGNAYPPHGYAPSAGDNLLVSISSSTPGTCDHYFPLKKSESLPAVFQTLAGAISRGKLTQ